MNEATITIRIKTNLDPQELESLISWIELEECEVITAEVTDFTEETESDYSRRMAEEFGDYLCDVGRGT